MDALPQRIRRTAAECGFDAVGFTSAAVPETLRERLMRFISLGRHGEMGWLEDRAKQRAHPQSLWPDAKSVIMLGMNYGPDTDPLDALKEKSNGVISVYAQNRDYHDLVKKRLKRLARQLVEETGTELKVFVDTAPVMEKPLAAQAGLGWQGKHTNLVSRDFGSWLFLGAIFTAIEIQPDDAARDKCGSCQDCLDICPTSAFPAPYQLDARRCISYLTIEHSGPIPVEFRAAMANRIYGCDDCLAACPWNKFASNAREQAFHARDELRNPDLRKLAGLDDATFRTFFSGSPVKRTGRNRFVRNVMIAIGNSTDKTLLDVVVDRLKDENPLVRGAAIWALSRLSPERFNEAKHQYAPEESDTDVQAEWNQQIG